jgi:hypothetical protein
MALIGRTSKFHKFLIILSLLTLFLLQKTLAQTHYTNNNNNHKSLSLLHRILEGIPNYCGIRLIFQNLNSEQVQPSLLNLTSVISLFRFENEVTVHNGRLNESYRMFYDFYSRYVNCTLNLILPPSKEAPSGSKYYATLQFLNDSIRLLISEPVNWNIKEVRYIKATSAHFNLILLQGKLSKAHIMNMTDPKTLLYSSSSTDNPFYLNKLGVALQPAEQPHLINLCIQNQGTTPSLSNMHCLHVNKFSLDYLSALAKPPTYWLSYVNNNQFNGDKMGNKNHLINYEEHILSEMMRHSNCTWISHQSPPPINTWTGQIIFAGGMDIASTLHSDNYIHLTLTSSTDSMRFLTCYSTPFLSFNLYVDPFEISTWTGIFTIVFIIATLLHILMLKKTSANRTPTSSFSPTCYLLSTLLDQADEDTVPKGLRFSQAFRFAIALWLLSIVLLSNIYLSKVIAQLNSPLRSGKLDYYKDIVCPWSDAAKSPGRVPKLSLLLYELWIFWWTPSSISDYVRNHTTNYEGKCFSYLSTPTKPFSLWERGIKGGQDEAFKYVFPYLLSTLIGDVVVVTRRKEIADKRQNKTIQTDHTIVRKMFSSWLPAHRFFPRDPPPIVTSQNTELWFTESVIENELVKCRKSALIGDEPSVSAEFDYLRKNYEGAPFQTGSVDYLGRIVGWGFEHPGNSSMPGILRQFVERGILGQLARSARITKYLKRRQGTKNILRDEIEVRESRTKPLELGGSIQTIFIIWAALLSSGVAIWLSEIVMRYIRYRINSDPLIFIFLN